MSFDTHVDYRIRLCLSSGRKSIYSESAHLHAHSSAETGELFHYMEPILHSWLEMTGSHSDRVRNPSHITSCSEQQQHTAAYVWAAQDNPLHLFISPRSHWTRTVIRFSLNSSLHTHSRKHVWRWCGVVMTRGNMVALQRSSANYSCGLRDEATYEFHTWRRW